MDRRAWEAYFLANAARRAPRHDAVVRLPEAMHGALVASLQRFHLGEAGEGRVANEARHAACTRDDAPLVASIGLYVREEGRHARELAILLRALGAKTLVGHPSEVLFRRGRRALGFRNKMIAIACAEVVGIYFYRLLERRVPDAGVADLGALIAADEEAHLRFQRELFAMWLARASRVARVATLAWAGFVLFAASMTFVLGHGPLLRALGVTRRDALRGIVAIAREAQGGGAAGWNRPPTVVGPAPQSPDHVTSSPSTHVAAPRARSPVGGVEVSVDHVCVLRS